MADVVTGGCKCGSVRYSGEREAAAPFRCYCRDCQQLTGTGHADMLPLQADKVTIEGEYAEFEMQGGSGKSTWSGFCRNCGSPVTRRSARMSDRVYVHAGSLDDPAIYAPEMSIYEASAQPWDRPLEG